MKLYNTLIPYAIIPYKGIQYQVCRDFDHISRYKGLRQIAHNPSSDDRFVTLETPNKAANNVEVDYYTVPYVEQNRLDIIANKFLGSASYTWVLAYFNNIEDGFTVREGQRIKIPKSLTSLFQRDELLASIPPMILNLGSE